MTTRNTLKKFDGKRKTFRGRFERFGTRQSPEDGEEEQPILLTDIEDASTSQIVTPYVWFGYGKGFQKLGDLSRGDVIRFSARVERYKKGYGGMHDVQAFMEKPVHVEYTLVKPTQILLVSAS